MRQNYEAGEHSSGGRLQRFCGQINHRASERDGSLRASYKIALGGSRVLKQLALAERGKTQPELPEPSEGVVG